MKLGIGNMTSTLTRVILALSVGAAVPVASAQQWFASPQAAANAFVDGLARHDDDAIRKVLGSDYHRFIPAGAVSEEGRTNFLAAWAKRNRVVVTGDRAMLEVGQYDWSLPIPIARGSGGWRFDPRAGAEEMRIRRVGRNELAAIQVSLAYVDAQREYMLRDWNGDGVRSYAMRGLSTPGKRDGLYWASLPGEPESPAGGEFAYARRGQPYHGYLYRILTSQGAAATGGARSYVKNGRMTEGFALVAWPADYDDTGVMTFIVNQDGTVYQKDLGTNTPSRAAAIRSFNPDASWTKVTAP